jgi:hypothetical protein
MDDECLNNDSVVPQSITKRQKVSGNKDNTVMDASTFLFKSPSNSLEIENFTKVLEEFLNKIVDSQRNKTVDDNHDDERSSDPQIMHGYDTDEEKAQLHISNERDLNHSTALVRGNPRSYQTALFELAKVQNTIVNLPTGAGKTLVALLCIKHFASGFSTNDMVDDSLESEPLELDRVNQNGLNISGTDDDNLGNKLDMDTNVGLQVLSDVPSLKRTGKQTLFLVPSIALAIQHTATLRANLPFTVGTACNQMVRSSRARCELYRMNIIVATHGAARNLFMHYGDMFSLRHINLVIVDECHYAIGDHGYAGLFKNFYHTIERHEDRPRVLGLTASPLVNIRKDVDDEKLEKMLQELEATLDAKLASASSQFQSKVEMKNDGVTLDEREGSKRLTNQAIERVIHYHAHKAGKRYPRLPSYVNIGIHPTRIKEFNLLYDLYSSLGPKITAIYSKTLSIEVSRNRYDEETAEQFQLYVLFYLFDIFSITASKYLSPLI